MPVVGYLAPAVLEEGQSLNAVWGQLVEQALADLAVEHVVSMLGIAEQERHLEHRRFADHAVEGGRPGLHDLEGSAPQQIERLLAGAEPAVREDLDLDGAVGAILHELGESGRRQMLRGIHRHLMG